MIDVDPDSYLLAGAPTFSIQIGPVRASALLGASEQLIADFQRRLYDALVPYS